MFLKTTILVHQRGLVFRHGRFAELLGPGDHSIWGFGVRVEIVSLRGDFLIHDELDAIVASGALEGEAEVLNLGDTERALVWVDDRFRAVLSNGLYAVFTGLRRVRIERVDIGDGAFSHRALHTIVERAGHLFDVFDVPNGHVGLLYRNGRFDQVLAAGRHAYWNGVAEFLVARVDTRETILDVNGQDLMTRDKVTLRLNAQVTYRVVDAVKAHTEVQDPTSALYREAQLALRRAVGTRELDELLVDKDAVAAEVTGELMSRAAAFGLDVRSLGVRDIVLPGDMKALLNQVTEAKKAAEAAVITRREETAAIRSQANTAKLLAQNETLMRLRELETLERVLGSANLTVLLGEQKVMERLSAVL